MFYFIFFFLLCLAPEYTPYNKNKIIKEELKRPKLEPVKVAAKVVEEPPPPPPKKKDDGFVKLENYYYGIIVLDAVNDSAKAVKFRAQVCIQLIRDLRDLTILYFYIYELEYRFI